MCRPTTTVRPTAQATSSRVRSIGGRWANTDTSSLQSAAARARTTLPIVQPACYRLLNNTSSLTVYTGTRPCTWYETDEATAASCLLQCQLCLITCCDSNVRRHHLAFQRVVLLLLTRQSSGLVHVCVAELVVLCNKIFLLCFLSYSRVRYD